MSHSYQDEDQFFSFLRYGKKWDKPDRVARWDNVALAGFDTEYEAEPSDHRKNYVISYQGAVSTEDVSANIISYTRNGERLSLGGYTEKCIRAVNGGEIPKSYKRARNLLVLAAHFSVADWANFADRDQPHIRRYLKKVRKSPVTGNHTIKVTISRQCTVHVKLYDCMLLAPAGHQSLLALSRLAGAVGQEKIPIPDHYKSSMRDFLRDHPDKFEQYAIQDAVIARDVFKNLQENLNHLASGSFRKLFVTLAAAGVAGFIQENPEYKKYTKALSQRFSDAYAMIREGYMGGRNESFFRGNTCDYPETVDNIWPDIDFRNFYPSCLVTVPKIDVEADADVIPLRYSCDDEKAVKLAEAKVPMDIIADIRQALAESPEAFDRVLRKGVRYTRVAERVRQICAVVDMRLVNRWRQIWVDAVASGNPERLYCIPGFALVRVKFGDKTLYPCIPQKHEKHGLGFFLETTSVVTAVEVVLAMESGAIVEPLASLELPIESDENGNPIFPYRSYLTKLIRERHRLKDEKTDPSWKLKEQLYKELANSFYGKLGEGMGNRTAYQPSSGRSLPIFSSAMSEPCAAALATGLGRAALGAVLMSIDRYNGGINDPIKKITLISCCTDGLLLGLPAPPGYSVLNDYYTPNKDTGEPEFSELDLGDLLHRCNFQQLMPLINIYTPIKIMRAGRIAITGNEELFVVKHLVDSVHSIKTRGQTGYTINGDVHILARFGHRIPVNELEIEPGAPEPKGMQRNILEARWLAQHYKLAEAEGATIRTYPSDRLAGLREILESNGELDCVMLSSMKNVNSDFDFKRKPIIDKRGPLTPDEPISPFTMPHRSMSEMLQYRRAMQDIRDSGVPATVRKVMNRVAYMHRPIRLRNGGTCTLVRQFLRGVVQKHITLTYPLPTQSLLADRINELVKTSKVWSESDVKNARYGAWCPGSIPSTVDAKNLVEQLCRLVGADPSVVERDLLAPDIYESVNSSILDQVVKSLLCGASQGLQPFQELEPCGLIPSRHRLMTLFPQITEEDIRRCEVQGFIPGGLPRYCHGQITRVYRLLGLPRTVAAQCASIIAPPVAEQKRTYRDRIEEKCLRSFVQALFQPDVTALELKPDFIHKILQRYGLTRRQIYSFRRTQFVARTIKDTPANRSMIRKASAALDLDASTYLALLLDR